MLQKLEHLCSKYYIATLNEGPYVIKYHYALQIFNRSLGIVNAGKRHDSADIYSFYPIDKKSKGRPALNAFDFSALYNNSLTIISQLNHAFKMGHTVSKIHRYPARSVDIAALLSVWKTCPPRHVGVITEEDLREIYIGAANKNNMQGDFDRFLIDYTSGQTYAPIPGIRW